MNLLIGKDYAIFSLSTLQAWEGERIGSLLEVLEESSVTFLREGQPYTGKSAAAHLCE